MKLCNDMTLYVYSYDFINPLCTYWWVMALGVCVCVCYDSIIYTLLKVFIYTAVHAHSPGLPSTTVQYYILCSQHWHNLMLMVCTLVLSLFCWVGLNNCDSFSKVISLCNCECHKIVWLLLSNLIVAISFSLANINFKNYLVLHGFTVIIINSTVEGK